MSKRGAKKIRENIFDIFEIPLNSILQKKVPQQKEMAKEDTPPSSPRSNIEDIMEDGKWFTMSTAF